MAKHFMSFRCNASDIYYNTPNVWKWVFEINSRENFVCDFSYICECILSEKVFWCDAFYVCVLWYEWMYTMTQMVYYKCNFTKILWEYFVKLTMLCGYAITLLNGYRIVKLFEFIKTVNQMDHRVMIKRIWAFPREIRKFFVASLRSWMTSDFNFQQNLKQIYSKGAIN